MVSPENTVVPARKGRLVLSQLGFGNYLRKRLKLLPFSAVLTRRVAAMGRERYVVRLEREELDQLERLVRGGKSPVRKVARARTLLKADAAGG